MLDVIYWCSVIVDHHYKVTRNFLIYYVIMIAANDRWSDAESNKVAHHGDGTRANNQYSNITPPYHSPLAPHPGDKIFFEHLDFKRDGGVERHI